MNGIPVDILRTSFAVVPEPSTLFLLGTGILGLLGYGWYKRKRTA